MRRDFLKQLGIEDKDIIDKILDENSSDIGKAKGELETYKTKVTDLEKDIADKDTKIADLTKVTEEVTTLREKVTTLENEKTQLSNDLNTKVTALQKTHAIENGVRNAKAKNLKAVMALLDLEKIKYTDGKLEGLDSQLETLTKGEDTSFLFGETPTSAPFGTRPNSPNTSGNNNPPTSMSFGEAIAKAIGKN